MGAAYKLEELAVLKPKSQTRKPPLYKVVMLNDDYTPMEFVVEVLQGIYHKPQEEAMRLMTEVHNRGSAICGIYTREIAETKVDSTIAAARREDHPLQCALERE